MVSQDDFFVKLCNEINIVGCDWSKQLITKDNNECIVCINKLFLRNNNTCAKIEKQILINPDCSIKIFVYDEEIDPNTLKIIETSEFPVVKIENEETLQQFINWFNCVEVCQGGPPLPEHEDVKLQTAREDDYLNVWRHKNCPIVFELNATITRCKLCKGLENNLKRKEERMEKKATSSSLKLEVLRELKRDYMIKTTSGE